MAETATGQEKPKRHPFKVKMLTVMGKENPEEIDFDENEMFDKANEHVSGLEDYKSKSLEANQKLIDLIKSEPELFAIIEDMIKGASFREAIARHIDPADLTPMEGEPDIEGWKKNSDERISKMSSASEYQKTLATNKETASQAIEEFVKENNLSDEEAQDLVTKIDQLVNDILDFKVDKNTLSQFYKMINYDKDQASATEAAKIAGKNEAIVAKKEDAKKTDGLPDITTSSTQIEEQKPVNTRVQYSNYFKKNR